jgi:hypothetical protein
MARMNLKQQFLFTTISIAAVSIIIAAIIIVPTIKQILSLKNSITDTQKFLEEQYEKTQRMRRSVHSLDEIIEQTEKFQNIAIQEGDELKVITELEKLATSNNIEQSLRVQKIDPKETKGVPSEEEKKLPPVLKKAPYYTFSFSNTGNFENHISYLKELEKLPYYLNISILQFEKKGTDGILGLRFNANIYIKETK